MIINRIILQANQQGKTINFNDSCVNGSGIFDIGSKMSYDEWI